MPLVVFPGAPPFDETDVPLPRPLIRAQPRPRDASGMRVARPPYASTPPPLNPLVSILEQPMDEDCAMRQDWCVFRHPTTTEIREGGETAEVHRRRAAKPLRPDSPIDKHCRVMWKWRHNAPNPRPHIDRGPVVPIAARPLREDGHDFMCIRARVEETKDGPPQSHGGYVRHWLQMIRNYITVGHYDNAMDLILDLHEYMDRRDYGLTPTPLRQPTAAPCPTTRASLR